MLTNQENENGNASIQQPVYDKKNLEFNNSNLTQTKQNFFVTKSNTFEHIKEKNDQYSFKENNNIGNSELFYENLKNMSRVNKNDNDQNLFPLKPETLNDKVNLNEDQTDFKFYESLDTNSNVRKRKAQSIHDINIPLAKKKLTSLTDTSDELKQKKTTGDSKSFTD